MYILLYKILHNRTWLNILYPLGFVASPASPKSLNQPRECKSTLSNARSGSLRPEVQKRKVRTTALKLIALRSHRRYPNVSHKSTAFIYRSSALEQSDAEEGIGRNACRLFLCNVTLHVHFHAPLFWPIPLTEPWLRDLVAWRRPLNAQGSNVAFFFVEASDMMADLIHGHCVLLCLILSDGNVLGMYKTYVNACLANNQRHSSWSSPGIFVFLP